MDLCFDLRTISLEHTYSLPIKLFYYLACGRPVIYSKLKSLTTFFSNLPFVHLVEPSDTEKIANIMINYINNQEIYTKHCKMALNLSSEKYNWDKIKCDFIEFIQQLSKKKDA